MNQLDELRRQIDQAVKTHNAELAKLRRPDGKPLYADDVMLQQSQRARQALTTELDRIAAKVDTIAADAAKTAAAGRGDSYSWLTNDELQRAALLAPFIRQDIEVMGNDGLRDLEYKTRLNGGQIDRVKAWLLMREANMRDLPANAFERAAMPENIAEADQLVAAAGQVKTRVKMTRPEWREHVVNDVVRTPNWSATGEAIAIAE